MPLPTGIDLVNRLALDDSSSNQLPLAHQVAAAGLEQLRGITGIAAPSQIVVGEFPFVSSYNQTVVLDKRPVTVLTAVRWMKIPLRIGSFDDVMMGLADVTVAARGDGIELAGRMLGTDRRGPLSVDYAAGFDTLPDDLFELWAELAMLRWHETSRVGLSETRQNEFTVKHDRKLTPTSAATAARYRAAWMP